MTGFVRHVALSCGFWALAAAASAEPAFMADVVRENKIKAAYLYNLSRHVNWPEASYGDVFQICIKDHPGVLDAAYTIEDRPMHGGRLHVVDLDEVKDPATCQVLYVGTRSRTGIEEAIGMLGEVPILTVGDAVSFIRGGGMVRLMVINNTIRFEIDNRRAQLRGLVIADRLLQLANKIFN